jgi:hypothetical protein
MIARRLPYAETRTNPSQPRLSQVKTRMAAAVLAHGRSDGPAVPLHQVPVHVFRDCDAGVAQDLRHDVQRCALRSGDSGSAACSTARPGGWRSQDVHVAAADLHYEQAVQALEGHRAVHVKEIDGQHRRGLRVQELPPARIGAPSRSRRDPQRPEDPADRGRADPMAELEQLALDPLVPQPLFSVARCPVSAAISALIGGRPVRRG